MTEHQKLPRAPAELDPYHLTTQIKYLVGRATALGSELHEHDTPEDKLQLRTLSGQSWLHHTVVTPKGTESFAAGVVHAKEYDFGIEKTLLLADGTSKTIKVDSLGDRTETKLVRKLGELPTSGAVPLGESIGQTTVTIVLHDLEQALSQREQNTDTAIEADAADVLGISTDELRGS